MAGERTLPGLGLTAFWNLGDNTWKPGMDDNLRLLSALVMPVALDFVSATPGSPADGDVYIFDETHATNPNDIAIRDNGGWIYVTPVEGWRIYDVGNTVNRQFDGTVWIIEASGGGGGGSVGTPIIPGGRLTLVSGTPVQNTNETAKTAVYYTPYRGSNVPIYDGVDWTNYDFTERTLSLDTTNHTSGSVYDVFMFYDSGVVKIGTGPAWTSTTARGSGAGTTELVRQNGFWTNAVSITLKNGAGAGVTGVAAHTATYVGTIYCTANGQTAMNLNPAPAAGGNANVLGVFNAYNRVMTRAYSRDNSAVWNYTTGTWRAANASNSCRVTFIDGLGEDMTKGKYQSNQNVANTCSNSFFGCGFDSTTAAPPTTASMNSCTFGNFSSNATNLQRGLLGLHYYQGMEYGSTSASFGGAGAIAGTQNSFVEFEGMM